MIKRFRHYLKIFLLMKELRSADIFVGGYENKMVRLIGKRFLEGYEVDIVHKLITEGRIVKNGTHSITSPSNIYDLEIYKYR